MEVFKHSWNAIVFSYASVLFSSKKTVGFVILALTFTNPEVGTCGLLGCVLTNLICAVLGIHKERIQKGLYGLNGLLVGLSFSAYHRLDFSLILFLLAACILVVFISLSLEHVLGYYLGLPILSVPFVFTSIVVYFAFYNYSGFTLKSPEPILGILQVSFPELPKILQFYFKSLGGILFLPNVFVGLILSGILFYSSRIAFFLSIIGFLVGASFHLFLKGNETDLSSGAVGFNYILTSIAVGGYFLIPQTGSFFLGTLATLVAVLMASFAKIFLTQFSIPVLVFPFTFTTLVFLLVLRILKNPNYVVVDFPPGTPEENLNYYKTRLGRFGTTGLQIRLPFSGKWTVSQGYSGEYTHKEQWKESLDFMALDGENKVRKSVSEDVSDFYTFGLPVLAPSNGKVVKIINHIEDNPVGQVNTKDNWGNLVVMEHAPNLFSQVSHLQKNSILVKEGDFVLAGTKLGLAGNSGRSPAPHIHLHFQSTPEIGSPTTTIGFTQFLEDDTDFHRVKFNSVPSEKAIVSNLNPDYNLKTFFTIGLGESYELEILQNSKVYVETWKTKLDFLGNRFFEDEKENRMYFYVSPDSFSAIDYLGKTGSALFYFYLACYRIPFVETNSSWTDKISYKYFSNSASRLLKDFLQAFSNKLSYDWNGSVKQTDDQISIRSFVGATEQEPIIELEYILGKEFPGTLQAKSKKDSITIKRKFS